MRPERVLGQPAVFQLTDDSALPADLSVRERRLLVGALNFHAFMAPGRELSVRLYDGTATTVPRTTDDTTFTGLSRDNRARIGAVRFRSLVPPEERSAIPAEDDAQRMINAEVRHLHISRDDVLDFDPPRRAATGIVGRALRQVRARMPLLYDDARDLELLRHRSPLVRAVPRREYATEFAPGGLHDDSAIIPALPHVEGAPRAVLIGVHWFELGGAERWAFESIRLVREAGFLPVVLSNRDSHQPWINRPELDDALIVPFSEPTVDSQTPGIEELLRGILRTVDLRGVVVHHNQWLYDRLPWIAASRPGIPIVDSTHIVEFRGGGYPVSSALAARSITTHHVISPTLSRWMTQVQRIEPEKVVMAPLGGLTVEDRDATFRGRSEEEPFTIAFVGRMARQKAPEVFLAMAHRLKQKAGSVPLRFILHGDGELSSLVDDLIASQGLEGDIVRRTSATPVAETLDEAHVLVVPSHNEGLTLTTLEAITHGVPVVSTDVGAQSDIIPSRALAPRNARLAAWKLADIVLPLLRDESARQALWRQERKAEKKLLSVPSASEWFAKEVSTW